MQRPQTRPSFTPAPRGILQRSCACGKQSSGGECEECRKKTLQRSAVHPAPMGEVPPIVHEVLRSPGQPLDADTRAYMEPRFGHDFSGVRVHIDAKAAESARAVNARAYTIGSDVAFGESEYRPDAADGRRLLAHELAHVVQQGPGLHARSGDRVSAIRSDAALEREAELAGDRVLDGQPVAIAGAAPPSVQRWILTDENAGGCGICEPEGKTASARLGTAAHGQIRDHFNAKHKNELLKAHVYDAEDAENGFLDLAIERGDTIEVGEIKAANERGYKAGVKSMGKYVSALTQMYPDRRVRPLKEIIPNLQFPAQKGPGCPDQALHVNPPTEMGVYGYYCLPSRRTIRMDPSCECGPDNDRKDDPVFLPGAKPAEREQPETESPRSEQDQGPRLLDTPGKVAAAVAAAVVVVGIAIALVPVIVPLVLTIAAAAGAAAAGAASAAGAAAAAAFTKLALAVGGTAAATALLLAIGLRPPATEQRPEDLSS